MFWRNYKFQSRLARVRVRLALMLLRLFYGKNLSEVARTSVHSVEEWSAVPKIQERIVEIQEVFPPDIARYDFDASYSATFRRSKSFDAIKLVRLKDVVVSPQSGLVFLPDQTILQESVGGLIRILGWGKNIHEVLMSSQEILGRPRGTLVVAPSGIPYFHWLMESYPRLVCLLERLENPVILVNSETPSFVRDSIEVAFRHLGRRSELVISDLSVKADEAAFVFLDDWSGFVPPRIVDLLKDIASRTVGQVEKTRQIYISRRRARLRPVANEEEVELELARRGFEITYMEELDLASQWKVMAEANFIVSPHGAALSNLIACSPGTKVLEIFQSGINNDCYARLTKALHLDYSFLRAGLSGSGESVVNIQALLDAVEQLRNQNGCSLPRAESSDN